MDDAFELPVHYKGEELNFQAHLVVSGFSSSISVNVNGLIIVFEPDEERNYRAIADYATMQKQVDVALLKAIADTLRSFTT